MKSPAQFTVFTESGQTGGSVDDVSLLGEP